MLPGVYVAGKWAEKQAARDVMAHVRAAGYTITEDWTQHADGQKTADQLANDAMHDVTGVLAATAIIVLLTDASYPYRGSFFEMGVAIGANKRVLVVANPNLDAAFRKVAFFHLPEIEVFPSVEAAVSALAVNKIK
jgi:hypothetical protein